MKAVIFDMDGTLLDSERVNVQAIKETAEELGHTISEDHINFFAGRHPSDCLDEISKDINEEEFSKIYKEKYFILYHSAEIFQEAIQFIKTLKNNNIPVGLCTSGSRMKVKRLLERTNITFDAIVTFEDVSNRKPHPEPYLTVAKKLGVDPQNCLVFEDTELGVASAKAAGMKCVAVPTDATKHHDFSHADKNMDKIEDNLDILDLLPK